MDHPLPWRWLDHALIDANGEIIVARTYGPKPGPGTCEQLRAAPEMELYVREFEWKFQGARTDTVARTCFFCLRTQAEGHLPACGFGALLARIDAARKAGG